jgi:hypothetical protein
MIRKLVGVPVLSLLLLATLGPAAPQPERDRGGRPFPFGVVAADGRTAYVSDDAGGVEAVELASGKVLWAALDTEKKTRPDIWERRRPAQPLALDGDRLAVLIGVEGQANAARVVVLDVGRRGQQVLSTDPIRFPDWVSVGLDYGRTFDARGQMHKGDLYVRWEAHAFYDSGPPPTPEILAQAKKDAVGVARVNLESGAVERLPAERFPVELAPDLPKGLRDVTSAPYYVGPAPGAERLERPLVVRDRVAALRWVEEQKQQVISLKLWDRATGGELPTLELLRADSVWVWLSADGEHMLLKADQAKGRPEPANRAWQVFALATGRRLGQFVPESGATYQPTVIGGRAYFVETGPGQGVGGWVSPRRLVAVDLATGKEVWRVAVLPEKILPPRP